MTPKPGWKSTEFWFHIAAVVFATAQTIDLGDSDISVIISKVIAVIVVVLGSLGYTVSRSFVKSRAAENKAFVEAWASRQVAK